MSSAMRFLVVSFDGLRPDLISDKLTPHIARLARRGVTLGEHRTVYPSETRVGFPSLVTGASPGRHGLVGNKYVDRDATPPRYVDTADQALVAELAEAGEGRLLGVPSMGEILAADGHYVAALSTNFPGTVRLFHHAAERHGHVRLSGHEPQVCTPPDFLEEVEARFGTLPPPTPRGTPDLDAQRLLTDIFLDMLWPRFRPDLTFLGYGEPDVISHFAGTGDALTQDAIRYCDAQFGRLLDWWDEEGLHEGVNIVVVSDHGHITGHSRGSVNDTLILAGFRPGPAPAPNVDAVVVPGQVGAVYLTEPTPDNIEAVVAAFVREPWCGCLFTNGGDAVEGTVAGTFNASLALAGHPRAPDVAFTFRCDDGVDAFGLTGGTWYDNDRWPGLGLHGGLHPKELAAVGIVAGPAFRDDGHISSIPTGIGDFAPTILHLRGKTPPMTMDGRIVREALRGGEAVSPIVRRERFTAGRPGYHQEIARVHVDGTTYGGGRLGAQRCALTILPPLPKHSLTRTAPMAVNTGILTLSTRINMSGNLPPKVPETFDPEYRAAMAEVLARFSPNALIGAHQFQGSPEDREQGAAFSARRYQQSPDPARVILTNGTQSALTMLMMGLVGRGNAMAVEAMSYPTIKQFADLMGIDLHPVAMDDEGLIPDVLDELCGEHAIRAVYAMPTLQNPTTAIMSVERRAHVAAICRKHRVAIIEDDIYSLLPVDAPLPLATFAPELSWYVLGTAKSIAAGLKVAYVVAPDADAAAARFWPGIRATYWMVAPANASVMSAFVRSGGADRIIGATRKETRARQAIVGRVLAGHDLRTMPECLHAWLRLPARIDVDDLAKGVAARGVDLGAAPAFRIGNADVPNAIRFGTGAAPNCEILGQGLAVIGDVYDRLLA